MFNLAFMAVPKKKTSRSKRNFRRYIWNKKIYRSFLLAFSLMKSKFQSRTK